MKRFIHFVPIIPAILAIIIGTTLTSSTVSADDTVSTLSISVPTSCTMNGIVDTPHSANVNNGQYNSNIGTTTMKAFCNDSNGFAIYSIGYTNEEYGNNVLTNASLGSSANIVTGTATSGNTSNWAMKLTTDTSATYPISIENSYDSFHTVPNDYELVAKRTSATDMGETATGSIFTTTYQAYIAELQPAGTYSGKVKYTLVHPNDANPPEKPIRPEETATLLDGETVNYAMASKGGFNSIKSIRMASSLPEGFVPDASNTVSTNDSYNPIYIFFDNTNNAGIMYFYTPARKIYMNEDSSYMFFEFADLNDISGITNWDASNVVNMSSMFYAADLLTDIDALANWDTSSVTDMSGMFAYTLLYNIDALINWNTTNVTNMNAMFADTHQLADINGASNWNTTNVTDMSGMFYQASILSDISGAASWDTSSVTNISEMFFNAFQIDATILNGWDVSNVIDMSDAFTITTDKEPCWYNGTTCPSASP